MSDPEFITVIQLAQRLMLPKATAYYFVQKGKIPGAFRVGKLWRLKKKMVDDWIEDQLRLQERVRKTQTQASEQTHATDPRH